ncbi:MAG: hypothetical protein KDD61_09445 [Bdellovibrionales bacterium]|nr:hypothetical protein [Bdellovibrionales bacterium]
MANTTRTLKKGSATEIMVGTKSFLLSGTELELLYIMRNTKAEETTPTDTKDTQIQLLAHLFF